MLLVWIQHGGACRVHSNLPILPKAAATVEACKNNRTVLFMGNTEKFTYKVLTGTAQYCRRNCSVATLPTKTMTGQRLDRRLPRHSPQRESTAREPQNGAVQTTGRYWW